MTSTSTDLGENSAPSPVTSIDWRAAFQSSEFVAELQSAMANGRVSTSTAQLERLGDALPTTSSAPSGNSAVQQGTFTAPFVAAVNGSVPDSFPPSHPSSNANISGVFPIPTSIQAPNISLNPLLGPEKAFSLGPGRSPIPPKLVAKILANKYVELADLLPENLDDPLSDTTSFTIEGSTIVPVSKSARDKKTALDILSWVECFTSYASVIGCLPTASCTRSVCLHGSDHPHLQAFWG